MFSLALDSGTGGYIAFGGLPPVDYIEPFASAPIEMANYRTGGPYEFLFYTIKPDAIVYKGSNATQSQQYIVDTGSPVNYFPPDVAEEINNLFVPKAQYTDGRYFVNCSATAPDLGIKIGGATFQINPANLIEQGSKNLTTGLCSTGAQGSWDPVLGDTFLQNVVAVFDVGAAQMRFAARGNY